MSLYVMRAISILQENICPQSIFFTFLVSLLADKYAARVFNGNKSAGLPELISSRTIPYFLSARYARYRKISLSTARSGSEINLDGFCYRNFDRDPYREFDQTKKVSLFLTWSAQLLCFIDTGLVVACIIGVFYIEKFVDLTHYLSKTWTLSRS